MAERLCVCGHNEDWHRAIICGAARCDCEQYEQTTRIAELEAELDKLREALEITTRCTACHFCRERAEEALNKADTNPAKQMIDEAKKEHAEHWLKQRPGGFKADTK